MLTNDLIQQASVITFRRDRIRLLYRGFVRHRHARGDDRPSTIRTVTPGSPLENRPRNRSEFVVFRLAPSLCRVEARKRLAHAQDWPMLAC